MATSSWANARTDQSYRGEDTRGRTAGAGGTGSLDHFASWIEGLLRRRGYEIDSPRGGGKSRLADDAGVHRAAVSRLLQRQSMPDLETMRRLAAVLDVPLRDMLIRSGRLSEDDLPINEVPEGKRGAGNQRISPEEAAWRMGVPPELQEIFVKVAKQFLPDGD